MHRAPTIIPPVVTLWFYIVLGSTIAFSGQTRMHEAHSSHLSPITLYGLPGSMALNVHVS